MVSEIIRKVDAACAFGTPDAETTEEIVAEVRGLELKIEDLTAKISQIRQLATAILEVIGRKT
jgi:hypothetical protein